MPKDYLFPTIQGSSTEITLTADTDFTASMLGCIVNLAGFTLTLGAVSAFGTFTVNGAGFISGDLEAVLGVDEARLISLASSEFRIAGAEGIPQLALTEIPINGKWKLQTAFSGANNDLVFTADAARAVPSVVFALTSLGFPSPGDVSWDSASRVLTVNPAHNGTTAVQTAASILEAISRELFYTGVSAALAPGNSGAGVVGLMALTALTADNTGATVPSAIDQSAVVRTMNDGRLFYDRWSATSVLPAVWNPPGDIYLDRQTGDLLRSYIGGGVPTVELAYP